MNGAPVLPGGDTYRSPTGDQPEHKGVHQCPHRLSKVSPIETSPVAFILHAVNQDYKDVAMFDKDKTACLYTLVSLFVLFCWVVFKLKFWGGGV